MTPTNDNQARTWAAIAHLSSLIWIPLAFIGLSFPILNIVGPLIVWLSKKRDSRFIDEQGKESLNFQISFTIYTLILLILLAIVAFIFGITLFGGGNPNSSATQGSFMATILGLGLLAGVILLMMAIIQLILVIIAAVKAKNGQHYRYPLTIRLIR